MEPTLPAQIDQTQSALDPGGANAEAIAHLSWTMILGGGLIFLVVMMLITFALWGGVRRKLMCSKWFVIGGGLVFPVMVMSALLSYGLSLMGTVGGKDHTAMGIDVTGHQFWWRVRYSSLSGSKEFETANEIRIPVGQKVAFHLRTADVIHSFWIPQLSGKLDMIPGKTNRLVLEASRPGVYRGQCAEFCGASHAWMALEVIALPADQFDSWKAEQSRDAIAPSDPVHRRGQTVFLTSGCGACHTVRGTAARGSIGPDLTHVGGRGSIAAATLPTHAETLARWVVANQSLKPGNRMPNFEIFTSEELRELAAYLKSLR
jgi:cytochrome c oxidase subunit 2